MSETKNSNLLARARELKEAALANATQQVMEGAKDEHRKMIYEKLNRSMSKKLNENIYEDEEESALDKLLHGDSTSTTPDVAGLPDASATPDVTATPEVAGLPDASAADMTTTSDVTGLPDASNDVSVDSMDATGNDAGVLGAEAEAETEKINPKDILGLTRDDLKDLDAEKLRELTGTLLDAYQNQEITVPAEGDAEVDVEIPETGTETPEGTEDNSGLVGDETGEMDAQLAGGEGNSGDGGMELGTETGSEMDNILAGEDEEEEQGALNLESKLLKRQKQLNETIRKKRATMKENADQKILLQDDDDNLDEEITLEEEVDIMSNNRITELKNKLKAEIEKQKLALTTGGRSEKTLNESLKRKIQKKLVDSDDAEPSADKLREQNEILRHERDVYSRRLKDARRKLLERDEKLDVIENELESVTNYTLRYSTLQKLFTNNPIVRKMNEAQKEEVIDIIDSVKGLPKDEARQKLEEIYNDFQEETKILSEGKTTSKKSDDSQESDERPAKKSLNENRKRSLGKDVKPMLDSRRVKEETNSIYESTDFKRMLEIADISEDTESED